MWSWPRSRGKCLRRARRVIWVGVWGTSRRRRRRSISTAPAILDTFLPEVVIFNIPKVQPGVLPGTRMKPSGAWRVPKLLLTLPQVLAGDGIHEVLGSSVAGGRRVHEVAQVGIMGHAAVDAARGPRHARHALRAELRPRVLRHIMRRLHRSGHMRRVTESPGSLFLFYKIRAPSVETK